VAPIFLRKDPARSSLALKWRKVATYCASTALWSPVEKRARWSPALRHQAQEEMGWEMFAASQGCSRVRRRARR